MSECYRVELEYADGTDGPASVVLKVAATDPGEQADGSGAGTLRTGGAVLHRHRAPHRRSRRALLQRGVRPRDRHLPSPARRCRSRGRRRRDPRRHNRTGERWRWPSWAGCTRRSSATRRWPTRSGSTASRRMNQALSRSCTPGSSIATATRSPPTHRERVRAVWSRASTHTASRRSRRHAFTGWCTATTGWTTCCSARPDADRPLTVVDWQTVTWGPAMTDVAYFLGCALPDDAAPRPLRRTAARVPRRLGAECHRRSRRRPGRRSPPELLRRDDGDRRIHAGRAHRAWRRDVHGRCWRVMPSTCSTPMHWRRLPEPAAPEPLRPSARRRGAAHGDGGAVMERELVLRLRRRTAGCRRLDTAWAVSKSAHRVDQRAAVRPEHADRRPE